MKSFYDPASRTLRIAFANGTETTIDDLDEPESRWLLAQLDVELAARRAALTNDGLAPWRSGPSGARAMRVIRTSFRLDARAEKLLLTSHLTRRI